MMQTWYATHLLSPDFKRAVEDLLVEQALSHFLFDSFVVEAVQLTGRKLQVTFFPMSLQVHLAREVSSTKITWARLAEARFSGPFVTNALHSIAWHVWVFLTYWQPMPGSPKLVFPLLDYSR